jgi:hypothetical protein
MFNEGFSKNFGNGASMLPGSEIFCRSSYLSAHRYEGVFPGYKHLFTVAEMRKNLKKQNKTVHFKMDFLKIR